MEDERLRMEDERSVPRPSSFVSHRLLVRFVCLIAAVLCLLPISDKDVLLVLVPAISSFVAVSSIVSTRAIQPIFCLGIVAGLVALFRHRWFCRWVCPMGLCLDGASHLGRRLKRRPCRAMSIGRWLFALTLGGAILGYPLFLWCDPLALFSGIFLLGERDRMLAGAVSFLVVMLLLILSVLWPHVWCRGLCPLGAFQDFLYRISRSTIDGGRWTKVARSDFSSRSSLVQHPSSLVFHSLGTSCCEAYITRIANRGGFFGHLASGRARCFTAPEAPRCG